MLEGRLPPEQHARALEHIDGCAPCRELVAQAGLEEDAAPLAPGSLLGRYVILGVLGAGAMGVVYGAHDPSLDRKIALKLLRTDTGEEREAMSARLLREARALARLAHPNVVTIHDVGTHEREVFLAMELVEDGTLRRWLSEAPRSWREVLRMFLQAGEGLAAAHAQGIVHRDFKPDNVLIGRDGRVRVTDFGLARGALEFPPEAGAPRPALAPALATRTGALAGTPAYMAPEQLEGRPATPLSDQYAFCVALHEALWGTRPGADKPLPAGGNSVPAALRRILARGLATTPEERWPDLRALLGELERVSRRTSPWRQAALAVAALLVASIVAWRASSEQPCSSGFDAVSEGWNAAAQEKLRETLLSALGTEGQRLLRELEPRIEARARETGAQRREACMALHVRKEISATQFDQRILCLDRRRSELISLLDLLHQGDRALRGNAIPLVLSLPDPGACRQHGTLSRRPPLPADPVQRARVQELDARLTQAETRALALVQQEEARQIASEVLEQATALGWMPLAPRALLTLSKLEPNPQQASRYASEAAEVALATQDDEILADIWLFRIDLDGHAGHLELAEDHGRLARGVLRRLGGDPLREATRLGNLCRVQERAGLDLDLARSLCQEARDLLLRERPGELFQLAFVEERLGNVLFRQERYSEAERAYRSAIDKRQRILPPDSDLLVNTRGNLAESLLMQGHQREALALFQELTRLNSWWHLLDGLALAHWRGGAPEQAAAVQRRALESCIHQDPQGLCSALASIRLAEYLLAAPAGEEEARELLRGALVLREKSVQIPPFEEARAHLLLARIERVPGRATAHREQAARLLAPVAHLTGRHRLLLESARDEARPLPPL